ncbi:hypothetical protein [Clostridium perfringens]|uniref:hypothetical protein n=1 Tax=Clostridium perfringens TaxID=1502 RepID=UPI00399D482B
MKIFKRIYLILLIVITLIAMEFYLYPSVSNYINNKYAVNTISEYKNSIKNTSEDRLNELVEKSRIYNIDIAKGITPKDKFESGYMLGYINIPKINVELPIYEGTSKEILKKGVGGYRRNFYTNWRVKILIQSCQLIQDLQHKIIY